MKRESSCRGNAFFKHTRIDTPPHPPTTPAYFFEGQADVVEAVNQAVLAERVNFKRHVITARSALDHLIIINSKTKQKIDENCAQTRID